MIKYLKAEKGARPQLIKVRKSNLLEHTPLDYIYPLQQQEKSLQCYCPSENRLSLGSVLCSNCRRFGLAKSDPLCVIVAVTSPWASRTRTRIARSHAKHYFKYQVLSGQTPFSQQNCASIFIPEGKSFPMISGLCRFLRNFSITENLRIQF